MAGLGRRRNGRTITEKKKPFNRQCIPGFSWAIPDKSYLPNENLHFIFPLVDMEEYRLLNGWSKDRKKGSCRYDRIPLSLYDEVVVAKKEDYLQFLPEGLPQDFTVKDLSKAAKIPVKNGRNGNEYPDIPQHYRTNRQKRACLCIPDFSRQISQMHESRTLLRY